jgi:hypothetical protein
MSLNSEQLNDFCQSIINDASINERIVILCEGKRPFQAQGRQSRSPQRYRRMEHMPDANFYKSCVPKGWYNKRPEFYNCGDRNDVINTYFHLLNIHAKTIHNSYLSPDKLFALTDLDIQSRQIENYLFQSTEEIYCDLYYKAKVNLETASRHQIWVTGLIHKEAYFLLPEVKFIFEDYCIPPTLNGNKIDFDKIYFDMAIEISNDVDLQSNFKLVSSRISYCSRLHLCNYEELGRLWMDEYKNANSDYKIELIHALLTISKAKKYWEKIKPPSNWSRDERDYRDMISLEIGKFYSRQSWKPICHINTFFYVLHKLVYGDP